MYGPEDTVLEPCLQAAALHLVVVLEMAVYSVTCGLRDVAKRPAQTDQTYTGSGAVAEPRFWPKDR